MVGGGSVVVGDVVVGTGSVVDAAASGPRERAAADLTFRTRLDPDADGAGAGATVSDGAAGGIEVAGTAALVARTALGGNGG